MTNKRSKKDTSNLDFYFTILTHLKNENNPKKISEKLNVSKQKIYYYTRVLKELGFIEKESYGKWIVKRSKKDDLEHALNWRDKKIRGHAFIWKVKQKRKYDWKLLLERNNLKYKLVRGYTPRLFIKDKKVWLGKETITIYETKSFYGKDAFESRKYAVIELIEVMKELQRILGIKFKYFFKPTREHFGMIKNELAQQLNRNKEKLIIRDDLDGEWLWVDDSTGMMGEFETGGKGFTKDRAELNKGVQGWWNEQKKTNFKVTPTFVLNAINGVTQNQIMFDNNFQSHLQVIKQLGEAVTELKEEVKKLKKT
ncbi:MAG: helix-turn-helix domain-containing protein [Nanoarchaeota archaeon]|nr:helix-turn-helix domain-containing protein [Nanoarchaeota archaeon]